MKHKRIFLTILLAAPILAAGLMMGFQQDPVIPSERTFSSTAEPLKDQIIVKFKTTAPDARVEALIQALTTRMLKRVVPLNIYILQIPEGESLDKMLYLFSRSPDVEYAEPNYPIRMTATPNDLLFPLQYALSSSSGIPGSSTTVERPDIHAPEAWEETKGDPNIIIAILDTGIDLTHPDLVNKVVSSGRDFINDDFDATDDHGHGTHVAGIAAAETNNSEGIAGVSWNCKILPVKILDQDGDGDYGGLIQGLNYAANNGAHVINLSLGGDMPHQGLADALVYAYERDIVITAATGNSGTAVLYPAAYDAYCLAVAATDKNNERTDWSNFGPEVDVAAPGHQIMSCWPVSLTEEGTIPYREKNGTSMASPHVAGLAALIKSFKPWLTASQIMDIIRFSAEDINSDTYPGNDQFLGYGRINMENALVPIIISNLYLGSELKLL